MKVYNVCFRENSKGYYFKSNQYIFDNVNVIVETEKGLQYGKILNSVDNKNFDDYKDIIRIATKEDKEKYYDLLKEADEALIKCRNIVKELNLNMNVLNAYFTFEKEQLVFSFTSDERVDFRELAKKLAYIYHTRIELRQIGARDKAKEVGGIGVCGQKLCCTKFLNKLDTISMNMAKNQNLALNPSKINGVCGRLLCCLQYEDENYLECLKDLPNMNSLIDTPKGKGKVVNMDILNKKVKVQVNDEYIEVDYNEK